MEVICTRPVPQEAWEDSDHNSYMNADWHRDEELSDGPQSEEPEEPP